MPTTPPRRPTAAPSNPATRPASDDTAPSTPPKSVPKILPADSRVGRYVVRRLLGRGGMGCVYLAWDDDLRRTVAVKVMHPQLADESEHRQRFTREARAVAAISHDNVVSIFEVSQSDGLVFYAMPHLTGMSLVQFLNERGRPSVTAAVRIAREMASGLAAAHARGLLHRDIKPGNVFLESPRGRVKLLDFGLATSASGDGRLTEPGMVVGTPAYMSPEQARGLPLDARADLFSLGAVMYHLTTGRMPFQGPDTLAVLTALAVDTPSPVRDANPRVTARLEDLINRLLSKHPDGRPASATDVVAELKAIERDLAGGVTDAVVVPAEVVEAEAVPESETEIIPERPAEDDPPKPPTTRRKRRGKKAKKDKWRRYLDLGLIAVGVVGVLALILGITLLLANLNSPAGKSSPSPTTGAAPTPPARESRHPWQEAGPDGQMRWMANDRQGQPRPLPDFWQPGMRLPPDFPPPQGPPPN
jgi:serine/threonine protein kinase